MALMGKPPLPWQQHVADVLCELDEDGSWYYKTATITVPRQSGKTTLVGALLSHRAMAFQGFRGWLTAQTGLAARQFFHEMRREVESAMPGRWQWRLSAGEEAGRWEPTGSFWACFPPNDTSLHGKVGTSIFCDEVFSYTPEQGDAILQAAIPTMATQKMRQLVLVSTAGDQQSVWMLDKVEKGRASLSDPDSRLAHFEWGAPEEAPWDDPATWAEYHPAYGLTQDPSTFVSAAEVMGEAQFRRGYLNQWPAATTDYRVQWFNCGNDPIPVDAPVWIGADAPPSASHGSVVAAAVLEDGRVAVEVLEHHAGVDWLPGVLTGLWERHGAQVFIARGGPLGHLADQLTMAGTPVNAVTAQQFADAANTFVNTVTELQVTHPGDPRLDQAIRNSVLTESGERTVWRRRDQGGWDISPTVACALAVYGARLTPGMQVF